MGIFDGFLSSAPATILPHATAPAVGGFSNFVNQMSTFANPMMFGEGGFMENASPLVKGLGGLMSSPMRIWGGGGEFQMGGGAEQQMGFADRAMMSQVWNQLANRGGGASGRGQPQVIKNQSPETSADFMPNFGGGMGAGFGGGMGGNFGIPNAGPGMMDSAVRNLLDIQRLRL